MNQDLQQRLRCPATHQQLSALTPSQIATVNDAIAKGALQNDIGADVTEAVEGGLLREDGALFFPIRDGLISLVIDMAIPAAFIEG